MPMLEFDLTVWWSGFFLISFPELLVLHFDLIYIYIYELENLNFHEILYDFQLGELFVDKFKFYV